MGTAFLGGAQLGGPCGHFFSVQRRCWGGPQSPRSPDRTQSTGSACTHHGSGTRATSAYHNRSFLSRSNIRLSRKLDRRVPERAAVTARVAQLVAATYVSRSGADARLRCGRGRGASVGLCAGVGASSPVTTSLRCRNDRPSRSRRHTTGVSPGRSCSKAASSCGRRSSAPAARSVQTFHHPAAVSSSTCRSGFCSVVAGGGVPVVAGEHRHDDGWRQVGVHLFGALAQFEREIIRDRTVAGLTAARARGRVGGRPSKLSAEQRRQARKMYEE